LPAIAQLKGCPENTHAPVTSELNAMWNWCAKSALSPNPVIITAVGSMLSSGKARGVAAEDAAPVDGRRSAAAAARYTIPEERC
jgi:hypothetical protein